MIDAVTAFLMASIGGMATYISVKLEKMQARNDVTLDRNTEAFVKLMTLFDNKNN